MWPDRPVWLVLAAAGFARRAAAEIVERDFRIGWVLANPDGAHVRPVVGVNGAWPVPQITASVGDRLVLTVHNDLGNASTSLHFHGFFQNGTSHMDGAVGVTQCAIPPGGAFTYDMRLAQAGTYWYHAHDHGQYMDGLRGAVVVHDPRGPYEGQYDAELVLTLSDWYHAPTAELLAALIDVANPTGAEPVPPAALINDTQNLRIPVRRAATYLVRLVNVGGFASHYVWFAGHTVRIVEADGVWTAPAEAAMLYLAPAQRYSVLLTTRGDGDGDGDGDGAGVALVSAMDEALFDEIPGGQNSNVTAWLVFDDGPPLPPDAEPAPVAAFDAFDDFGLVPLDGLALLDKVDHTVQLDVTMGNLGDGANYAFFNDKTYVAPKVPSLYTALSVGGANASAAAVYGSHTNTHVLRRHAVVEVVLNNADDSRHPFHLHGHNVQLVRRSAADAGPYVPPVAAGDGQAERRRSLPAVPMRRDTVYVEGNGHVVLRFRADNPGVWLFHCHIEWHVAQGLAATFVEAADALQLALPGGVDGVPADHRAACRAAGLPTRGNAAGNTQDVFDLRGENAPPPPLPAGFTAKGYVALFFSCVSAVLGMAVICWYGLLDADRKDEAGEAGRPRQRA